MYKICALSRSFHFLASFDFSSLISLIWFILDAACYREIHIRLLNWSNRRTLIKQNVQLKKSNFIKRLDTRGSHKRYTGSGMYTKRKFQSISELKYCLIISFNLTTILNNVSKYSNGCVYVWENTKSIASTNFRNKMLKRTTSQDIKSRQLPMLNDVFSFYWHETGFREART